MPKSARHMLVLVLLSVSASTNEAISLGKKLRIMSGGRSSVEMGSAAHTEVSMKVMSKADIMSTMTLDKATSLFMTMNHENSNRSLVEMISKKLSGHRTAPTGYAAVDTARDLLNNMMNEANLKKELEIMRCNQFDTSTLVGLRSLEQDIAYVNSEASSSRSEVLRAQSVIQQLEEVKLPRNREELREHTVTCKVDIATLRQQLYIVKSDIVIMEKILDLVCKDQNQVSSFLELDGEVEMMATEKCISCLAQLHSGWLQNGTLQPMLNSLRTELSKSIPGFELSGVSGAPVPRPAQGACNEQMIGENASSYRGCQSKTVSGKTCQKWTMQTPHKHTYTEANYPDGGLGDHNYCRNPGGYHSIWCYTEEPSVKWELCEPMIALKVPQGITPHDCANQDTCKLSQPNCDQLKDRFLLILAGLEDKRDDLSEELSTLETDCKRVKVRYEETIATLETQLKEEQTALATATTRMTQSQQLSVLSNTQHAELKVEYHSTMTECCTNKNALTSELCALEKIRGELYRLEGLSVFMADCAVSDWIDGECSASCGGGTQTRTRTVLVNVVNGSKCPPLRMERACSEEGCPVDCALTEWSGWSACTAECGEGVTTRTRSKVTEPAHGGDPCPEETQTESCNTFACNQDCVLSDWSSFGVCPKMCGGGHAERRRDVLKSARGLGHCDDADSSERLDYQVCNDFDCTRLLPVGRDVLQCTAMLDLMVVIDGSGSLRQYGWDQSKAMALKLIDSMVGGSNSINMGVLVYSGPYQTRKYKACMGQGESTPSPEDCDIKWVSQLTPDINYVRDQMEARNWPRGTTLTSLALLEAKEALKQGRQNAQSVVILITDGKPMSIRKTTRAARQVKDEARLVIVPVGSAIKQIENRVRKWASAPWQDNILEIDTFSVMNSPSKLNTLISDFCPQVV